MFKKPPAPASDEPEEKGSFKLDLYFWTQALVMALVFLILTFTLVGRVISVDGHSMVPTLHDRDLLLLQSIGYIPRQGDVVVLRKEGFIESDAPIVKRVIAVGGQHVQVDYSTGTVAVNGKTLDEPYINEIMVDPNNHFMNVLDVTVPEGSIYVMGDNRNHSADSRTREIGMIDLRRVMGKAVYRFLPAGRAGEID